MPSVSVVNLVLLLPASGVDISGRNDLWATLERGSRAIERWYQAQGERVLLVQPEMVSHDFDLSDLNPWSEVLTHLRARGYNFDVADPAVPNRRLEQYLVYLAGWQPATSVAAHGGMRLAVLGEAWYALAKQGGRAGYRQRDHRPRDWTQPVWRHA
ncbi:MAG: hypothetical protein EXR52_00190 [Dehalococcoidia bacterium]|nr:hypothetical protein [Dehalococcoidia bacterium]